MNYTNTMLCMICWSESRQRSVILHEIIKRPWNANSLISSNVVMRIYSVSINGEGGILRGHINHSYDIDVLAAEKVFSRLVAFV